MNHDEACNEIKNAREFLKEIQYEAGNAKEQAQEALNAAEKAHNLSRYALDVLDALEAVLKPAPEDADQAASTEMKAVAQDIAKYAESVAKLRERVEDAVDRVNNALKEMDERAAAALKEIQNSGSTDPA